MFALMFNNLTELTKIFTRENSMQQVLLHFSRSTGSKFVKQKEHFAKHFAVCEILVYFLELSMLINITLPERRTLRSEIIFGK